MKIISWNCNGALRKKFHRIQSLEADIYIIQECEDPKQSTSLDYQSWASNCLWIGVSKNKGLGVFAKPGIKLTALPLGLGKLESFLPCVINDQIFLLAVWARQANSPTFGYIGQVWKYLEQFKNTLENNDALMIGGFNSNARWDVWDRWWNHSDVVKILEVINIFSLYHHVKNENQGIESEPTFYMHRKLEKPYHIDYAFISKRWLLSSTLEVGKPEVWLEYSDHMPLVIHIN